MYSPFQGPTAPSYDVAVTAPDKVTFLRKVYLLMTGAVATSAIAAYFAVTAGASTPTVLGHGLTVPPLIGVFLSHPIIAMVLFFGGAFATRAVAQRPGLNVLALFALSAFIGLFIAPTIYFVELNASAGNTLSSAPVLHSFGLAVIAFVGLSVYALTTKRDLSMLGGFLSMGFFVVLGAILLNLFFGGAALSLAIASVIVLLFGGFVLYDTWRMLRAGEREPVAAALNLYLNFLNIFLALLQIFGSGSRRQDYLGMRTALMPSPH